jgi:hypothetical protein
MEQQHEAQAKSPAAPETDGPTRQIQLLDRSRFHPILQLQQSVGNRAVQRLLARRDAMLQPKLTVAAAHDLYEHEADHVAQQVIGVPTLPSPDTGQNFVQTQSREKHEVVQTKPLVITPLVHRTLSDMLPIRSGLLQRKCVCGGTPGTDGKCEECRKHESFEAGADFEARLSNRSGGSPLPTETRAFMEPRFAADFGGVRLHADSESAQLTRAVGAEAFTHGQDIYLGERNGDLESSAGKQLLAHELTHTIQQVGRAEPVFAVARKEDSSTTRIVAPTGSNICSLDHGRHIQTAATQAQTWLDNAIGALDSLLVAPGSGAVANATAALNRHFHSATNATAITVRGRLDNIRKDIAARVNLNVECHDGSDKLCAASGAHVTGNTMAFCPNFFDANDNVNWQSETIVHELAHALIGGPHITDRAYRSDRLYAQLSPQDALTNAESYGLLVWELGTRAAKPSTPPGDSFSDCPEDWKPLIRAATAHVQRWNRNAQTATQDRRPNWLTGWADLQTRYLGSTTARALDQAQKAFDAVEDALDSEVAFECETEGGGRCRSGSLTYWYALFSNFHICPAWKALGSENDRIIAMLAGLYGYKGGISDSDNSRRQNYAMLAHDLNVRFWS